MGSGSGASGARGPGSLNRLNARGFYATGKTVFVLSDCIDHDHRYEYTVA